MKFSFLLLLLLCVLGCKEDEAIELPQVVVNDLEISEGEITKTIFITLTLSFPAPEEISLLASTSDLTAEAGLDYEAVQDKTIIFEKGDQTKSLAVKILGDEEYEPNEEFLIDVSISGNALNSTATGIVTLINDDINTNFDIPTTGYTTPLSYAGMTLYWQDEFDGPEIDNQNWTFETGGSGWGNNELQFYTDENALIKEGNLIIDVRKETIGGSQYTSTRMITMDKMEFQYGRVDIRAALPYGQGIWPALWMLGANFPDVGWPFCGEIDIMEMIGGNGRENTVLGTAHWQGNFGKIDAGDSYTLSSGIFHDKFHVFSIIWTETSIKWYIDDIQYHTMSITASDRTEFQEPFFLIFNVAVGGNWPGDPDETTVFNQQMIVDYVRVFQDQ